MRKLYAERAVIAIIFGASRSFAGCLGTVVMDKCSGTEIDNMGSSDSNGYESNPEHDINTFQQAAPGYFEHLSSKEIASSYSSLCAISNGVFPQ